MKVCIVGFSNLRYMPYLYIYKNVLEKEKIDHELIFWDREGLNEKIDTKKVYVFRKKLDTTLKLRKLPYIVQYSLFTKRILKLNRYDRIIILTTLPAIFLGKFLRTEYPKRYMLDIRDYTYEMLYPYKRELKKTLDKSGLNVISSPGFKYFLPEAKYVLCHNFININTANRDIRALKPRKKNVINITFAGLVRYYNEIKSFLELIGDDERFKMFFYGTGPDEIKLKIYSKKRGFNNVYFYGPYHQSQKEFIYSNTDIIYCAYGNKNPEVRYSLPNKLYDTALYKIPILVTINTELARSSGNLSFKIDFKKKDVINELYNWYNEKIDWKSFEKEANIFIEKKIEENAFFEKRFIEFTKV